MSPFCSSLVRIAVRACQKPYGYAFMGVLFFAFICLVPGTTVAQSSITRVEYYLDTDPGYGSGTPVSITPGTDLQDLVISVDPATLSEGVHRLYVRARDAEGNWSMTNTLLFYKPYSGSTPPPPPTLSSITRVEYFLDTDPGYGKGAQVSISPGTDLQDLVISIDPATLIEGVHRLYMRALNSNGNWSMTNTLLFYKPYSGSTPPPPTALSSITRVEYYLDTDPGYGSGTPVSITPGTDLQDLVISVDPATLSEGVHRLYVRARDAEGNWSMTNTLLFYKPYSGSTPPPPPTLSSITRVEYFLDTDPGYGKGVNVPVPAQADISELTIPIDLTGLTAGSHKLFLRARDANGSWSMVNTHVFTVPPAFDQVLTITGSVPTTLCRNNSINVSYSATGTYNPANKFSIQLSDAAGSFEKPRIIGSVTSASSGTITGTIPGDLPGGSGYRIRVASSDPVLVSLDNGTDIKVGLTASITCPQKFEVNAAPGTCSARVDFKATGDGTITYSHQPGSLFPVGTTTVTATATDACGTTSCQFDIVVKDAEAPTANCKNATVTLNQSGTASITAAAVDYNSIDNCKIKTMTVSPSSFTTADIGDQIVTLTVTDDAGNTNSCKATVTVKPAPAIDLNVQVTNTSCGKNNGAVKAVIVSGGTAPFTYKWNTGANTPELTSLAPGDYTVTVTDAEGVQVTKSGTVLSSSAPAVPVITVYGPANLCIGQKAKLSASVGDSYLWSTGETSQGIEVTKGGEYSVTVTTKGCEAKTSKTVTFLNNHPPTLSFTGVTGFASSVVSPSSATPLATYRFEVRYTDADGDKPIVNNPQLWLDYEGNGDLSNPRDKLYYMLEKDPADQDVTDGKDYYFVTDALAESDKYKTSIIANDAGGCTTVFGPFDGPKVVSDVDVSIFANDITFSNSKPDINSQVTVYATIRNNSGKNAENFKVKLINQFQPSVTFPEITVPYLSCISGANSVKVSWTITTPNEPAWCPMQVVIDADNVLSEPNELDNQAIRPFTNGKFTLPGDIALTASANPEKAYIGSKIGICGHAEYRNTAVPLLDPSCAGATVTVTIVETNQTFYGYTNSNGDYCIAVDGPIDADEYTVKVHITDYTLDGEAETKFVLTVPPPCVGPNLISTVTLSPSTIQVPFSSPRSRVIVEGQSLTGTATVTNTGEDITTNSLLNITLPDGTPVPGPFTVPPLVKGETHTVSLPSMTFNYPVNTYIISTADYDNVISECNEHENSDRMYIRVLPNLPDIAPINNPNGWAYQCQFNLVSFSIFNMGGAPTGVFNAKLTISHNGREIDVQEKWISSIDPLMDKSVLFDFVPRELGEYTFTLVCDIPGAITEVSEINNKVSFTMTMKECLPDIYVSGCGNLEVKPADPVAGGKITVYATITNGGLKRLSDPFTVHFNVDGQVYPYTFNGILEPNKSQQVFVEVPAPAHGNNLITVTADVADVIREHSESNSATANLCWDFAVTNMPCGYGAEPFIKSAQYIGRPVTLATGLLNFGVYDATHVQIRFEVSGPGITGWQDLGYATSPADNNCACPYYVELPAKYSFQQVGNYQIRITADFENQYIECNDGNNQILVDVNVGIPLPDYYVRSQFIAPSLLNPDAGQPINIDVTYWNSGSDNANTEMDYFVQVNNDALGVVRVPGLLNGKSNTVRVNQTWSSDLKGVHVIRAIIDHKKEVEETDELNNEATRAIVVGKSPNMKFTTFAVNNPTPDAGAFITINATIQNAGHEGGYATYQLFYVDNSGEEVLIRQQQFGIDAETSINLNTPWIVADPRTKLIGRIINAAPVEYDDSDNEATTGIGEMIITMSSLPATCLKAKDGQAKVVIDGGQAPYTVQWDNGQTGEMISVGPGTYTATITDLEGSVLSGTVTVSSGASVTVDFTGLGDSYLVTDAAVTLSGSPAGGTFSGPGVTGSQFDPAAAGVGTHTIEYTYSDPGGCSNKASKITEVKGVTTLRTYYRDQDEDGYGNRGDSKEATTKPDGYVEDNTDCNDANKAVHPGAEEVCNGIDDDCDGSTDEGVATVYYQDLDDDGFGNSKVTKVACSKPAGFVTDNTDCDDTKAMYVDADGDGSGGQLKVACGGVAKDNDCDDTNKAIYPGATEVCNGKDDDCDGAIDEDAGTKYYLDGDGDGFGNDLIARMACSQPEGYVTNNTDCNDADKDIHEPVTYYKDADLDGYGSKTAVPLCVSQPPKGYSVNNTDCNDADATVYALQTYYRDADGDGFGNPEVLRTVCSSKPPQGYVASNKDCNDANSSINPGATEICGNGIDENCDGQIDEGCNNTLLINITDITVYEVEKLARLTISMTKESDKPVTVYYSTVDGTARVKGNKTNPADFTPVSSTVTFEPGVMSIEISVPIISDNIKEPTEYFTVQLSKPNRGGIGKGTGTVTILDGAPLTQSKPVMDTQESDVKSLVVQVLPNPSWHHFMLKTQSISTEVMKIRVLDILGRVVEVKSNVSPNTMFSFGGQYRPGTYFVEVMQGGERKLLKLVKQK